MLKFFCRWLWITHFPTSVKVLLKKVKKIVEIRGKKLDKILSVHYNRWITSNIFTPHYCLQTVLNSRQVSVLQLATTFWVLKSVQDVKGEVCAATLSKVILSFYVHKSVSTFFFFFSSPLFPISVHAAWRWDSFVDQAINRRTNTPVPPLVARFSRSFCTIFNFNNARGVSEQEKKCWTPVCFDQLRNV